MQLSALSLACPKTDIEQIGFLLTNSQAVGPSYLYGLTSFRMSRSSAYTVPELGCDLKVPIAVGLKGQVIGLHSRLRCFTPVLEMTSMLNATRSTVRISPNGTSVVKPSYLYNCLSSYLSGYDVYMD